jgi:cobyric acid synthase
MRRHFLAKASAAGFEVIDMETEFREDHTVTGRRYEYPTDTHWNNAGHEVFARAVQRSAVYRSFYAAAQ